MKKGKFKQGYQDFKRHIRQEKVTFYIYIILRAFVLLTMVAQIFNRNFENVFLCILTLVLLMLPSMFEMRFKIDLPNAMEIIIMLFIFAAEILGEINEYYIIFPFWDTMLHTINGFLAAAIGFSLVDILNRTEKLKFDLSPAFVSLVGFCFSMTIGVIWEFFEYGVDKFLGFDMQKDTVIHSIRTVLLDPAGGNKVFVIENINEVIINGKELGLGGYIDIGLIDTMQDLWVNFIGAAVFSIIGYFYIKSRGKNNMAEFFLLRRSKKKVD